MTPKNAFITVYRHVTRLPMPEVGGFLLRAQSGLITSVQNG